MTQHNDAILAFQQGRVTEALHLLDELLAAKETSELWNDWAAVQLGAGNVSKAEAGFTRALELDPQNTDAAANLGLLLLGKGDTVRSVPLLTRVLAKLPAEQQKVVAALLGSQAAETARTQYTISCESRALRVVVINDTFPDPEGSGWDRVLMQLLLTLGENGNDVTFIAREAEDGAQCEALLHQAGIHPYRNDSERLPCLGREAGVPSWSLRSLAEQNRFDVAILIQSFSRGISIPEHYLDDLRRYSPGTRIVVFADRLQPALAGSDGAALAACEEAADLAMRQREAFERADVVLFPNQDDAATLRESGQTLRYQAAPNDLETTTLASVWQSILAIVPKGHAEEGPSVMLVETVFSERLSARAGEDRILGQLECYVRLADQFLSEGKLEKAREQLRHIFGRAPELMRQGSFASQVFISLKRCYRKMGEVEMAQRCAAEARRCITARIPAVATRKRGLSDSPQFSVIVPTYNRLPVLRKCLAALEAQTLPSADFEVIVIDDGSSDGTEELLSQYRPPFRFQYLRQANSGTGAARRNGVAHASGEYLLLMNDDTICDRDLLKQHLGVQRAHPTQRWAVLGNFEYPAAARQRALTRYFCVEPFMFHQASMEEGCPYGYSHFITCNLSVPREAVVEAGSFDSIYKLSEDTELGIRLYERGYRVLYHPEAHAFHDHLPYPARSLIRRARVYGTDYFYMFGRHPRVMKEWALPLNLTAMDEENAIRILGYVAERRHEVEQAVAAVERWDAVDFEPFLAGRADTAAMVLNLLRQAVPAIHWFYLFETMIHTMIRELDLRRLVGERLALHAVQGA
jgi:glycosyltransferase involved in cell wall biosynthesis